MYKLFAICPTSLLDVLSVSENCNKCRLTHYKILIKDAFDSLEKLWLKEYPLKICTHLCVSC